MSLAARLAAGEIVYTSWSAVPDAVTVELLAAQAFDCVTLDMQHGGHHEDSVLRSMVPIQRAGRHGVVRKVKADLEAAGAQVSDHQIRRKMEELLAVAIQQMRNT